MYNDKQIEISLLFCELFKEIGIVCVKGVRTDVVATSPESG